MVPFLRIGWANQGYAAMLTLIPSVIELEIGWNADSNAEVALLIAVNAA